MIAVVHVGAGTESPLTSLVGRLGLPARAVQRPEEASEAAVILVQASLGCEAACGWLKERGWWRELPSLVSEGRWVFGLDTAMHLLAEGSEEMPRHSGLGLLPGLARRLGPGVKVPHMGWARTHGVDPASGLPDPRESWLYFAHTHALDGVAETCWRARHGRDFSALIRRGHVLGIQPRLECSGPFGGGLLQALLAWAGQAAGSVPDSTIH